MSDITSKIEAIIGASDLCGARLKVFTRQLDSFKRQHNKLVLATEQWEQGKITPADYFAVYSVYADQCKLFSNIAGDLADEVYDYAEVTMPLPPGFFDHL